MELSARDWGAGGKFQRRPSRPPAASPYGRPSEARRMRFLETAARNGSGWLRKLVDSGSRFIAGRTSRIFSSMFRIVGSEMDCQAELYAPDAIHAPSELTLSQEADHRNQSKDFGSPVMSEIEQLMKKKKYTRAQVDYLTGLICSRTFESSNERVNYDEGNEEKSPSLNRKLSVPQPALSIPLDVAASPAEIVKAYTSSRIPKASSSALSLQSQVFQKDKSSPRSGILTSKQDDLPTVPRSVLHIPRVGNPSGVGYPILRPRGRSSLYRMARSPYFNVNTTLNARVGGCTPSSKDGPAYSRWSPRSTSMLGSRQAWHNASVRWIEHVQ